jgi:hypothetical protein
MGNRSVAIALQCPVGQKIDGRPRPNVAHGDHDPVERVITMRGTGDHDGVEWVITMPWNG